MQYTLPPGMFDIVPHDLHEPWRQSHLWQEVEALMRHMAHLYGFAEIRTPILEKTELFIPTVGEGSDIVSKEMYTFEDRGNRSLTLRPEGTAPVMRAIVEGKLHEHPSNHKLYYIAPMFRYDRPQAGRYRQHHQFGVEAIGDNSPRQDAELIDLAYRLYTRLGLTNLKILLNSLGNHNSRQLYKERLKTYLTPHFQHLSADSQTRFTTNPLRILDSKSLQDQAILKEAPSILDCLEPSCLEHFEEVKHWLNTLGIPFIEKSDLVRGLDYYNGTVFEIVSGNIGAQSSIGGGGRYDGLLAKLGGPSLPTVGFGTGIERILQAMQNQGISTTHTQAPMLFLIALGERAQSEGFLFVHRLRQAGISVHMDYTTRKLSKLMSLASQMGARYVIVLGENELETGHIQLKELATGKLTQAPLDADALAQHIHEIMAALERSLKL